MLDWRVTHARLRAQVEREDKEFEEEFLSNDDPSILHFLLASGEQVCGPLSLDVGTQKRDTRKLGRPVRVRLDSSKLSDTGAASKPWCVGAVCHAEGVQRALLRLLTITPCTGAGA